ncbi:MAG: insulinase family protein [Planctomycetota bacterium]|jgi:Zn-dependent M16 (insulinase) family peptidase
MLSASQPVREHNVRNINFSEKPDVLYTKGAAMHGFTFKEVHELDILRAVIYILEHDKTGAKLLHFSNSDPDNYIAIGLRTPPTDDTGLPHILEHTVLCGSEKYPIKDPFTELYKSSMATFLNAYTYPDKTVYPCSSMVEKDFFNIASVYCDAVFHPIISENHFKQEGHHFDFKDKGNIDSDLYIKGIVYNEMKGAYSDLDSFIDRYQSKRIFAGSTYGFDSGGDPDAIPQLTYQQFKDFHAEYYHPSNSRTFLYGNLPTEKHLAFLNDVFKDYEKIQVNSEVSPTVKSDIECREEIPYPASDAENRADNSAVVLSFYTGRITDEIDSLGMSLLEAILLDTSASPLRKALIDSKLGDDLTDSGYAAYQLDTFFTAGLKGADAADTEKIYDLIIKTLRDLCTDGISEKAVHRSLHQFKLSSRQISGEYQRSLMQRVMHSWMYDKDPMQNLRFNEKLQILTEKCTDGSRFLESLIEGKIINNKHYCLQTFVPDSEFNKKEEDKFNSLMKEIKAGFSNADLEKIKEEADCLDKMQSEPNKPENLAKLPVISLKDVPKDPISLGTKIMSEKDYKLLYTDVFSNGVSYINISFDLSDIPDDLCDYLSLYIQLMTMMGAGKYDYLQIAELEEEYTGGISAMINISGTIDNSLASECSFIISAKALDENLDKMFDIITDKFLHFDLKNKDRFKEIVTQSYTNGRSKIVEKGHIFSASHAMKNISRNGWLAERISGVSQVIFFKNLLDNFDSEYEKYVSGIKKLQKYIINKSNTICSYTGSRANLSNVHARMSELSAALPEKSNAAADGSFSPVYNSISGIMFPASVNFNSQAFNAVSYTAPLSPALLLISNNLSFGYLWEEIRVKRGAYGCYAKFSPVDGTFKYYSYRDPGIKPTFDAYSNSVEYITDIMDVSDSAIEKCIIGAVKTLDSPVRPQSSCAAALIHHLCGLTDDARSAFRHRLLNLKGSDVKQAASEILKPGFEKSSKCILAGKESIEKFKAESGIDFESIEF